MVAHFDEVLTLSEYERDAMLLMFYEHNCNNIFLNHLIRI